HYQTRLLVGHVEFVAHHLPERGTGALAAIGLADEEGSRVVGMDDDPGVELQEIRVGVGAGIERLRQHAGTGYRTDAEAQHQGAGRGEEITARRGWIDA